MNATLAKESQRMHQAMPIYLGIQAAILVMTYLDSPVYMEAYQRNGYLTAGGWVGAWFVLQLFGLSVGPALLVGSTWRAALPETLRVRLAGGFLLGAIAGFLSLGLRFMSILPGAYFAVTGALALVLAAAYLLWNRRRNLREDLFP